MDYHEVADNDVVLTTYESVSLDSNKRGTLQAISWFRVVLDEGR